ncbi:hypothetical protein BpHYR1_020014 [Brachionus plicatilis]|uniref:Uncharacterized protein n=1 Tax=Brachionus plicatilis TaxID=10195 RepID=A0A3M7P724_BRAPC|nr:hypothetical protein BpHYR1_020014 [Brachionus plicatilis]
MEQFRQKSITQKYFQCNLKIPQAINELMVFAYNVNFTNVYSPNYDEHLKHLKEDLDRVITA